MSTNTYIGMVLALLGSNLCLLLLVLNVLGWINFLHIDLVLIENFTESTLSRWQLHFQTATAGWLIFTLLGNVFPAKSSGENDSKKKARRRRPWHHTALTIASVVATLALPHLLGPHRHRHPVLRRSLLGNFATVNSKEPQTVHTTDDKPTTIDQELIFSVDNMTCGGCGSHVRDLAESNLAGQQKSSSSFTINKVQVDWRAGVMSIYGTHLTDSVDRQELATYLENDGYPTSFLYSQ
eukprot:CAMPEP_0201999900 /NCGR_PEP_ID=MMETSP0905-20130828/6335_1 /ASSEMBLY_ACC=CAM_ASM_000554 /TAXON_ID=420261 /ORGANISM="Thalassiosira antarctica, Strain CCMP982" /LENGTH=237 /DNA_ID=CAMNT_0048556209 /DNA_START=8 /DNA_END=721 /DNA_ORIENTATION=+